MGAEEEGAAASSGAFGGRRAHRTREDRECSSAVEVMHQRLLEARARYISRAAEDGNDADGAVILLRGVRAKSAPIAARSARAEPLRRRVRARRRRAAAGSDAAAPSGVNVVPHGPPPHRPPSACCVTTALTISSEVGRARRLASSRSTASASHRRTKLHAAAVHSLGLDSSRISASTSSRCPRDFAVLESSHAARRRRFSVARSSSLPREMRTRRRATSAVNAQDARAATLAGALAPPSSVFSRLGGAPAPRAAHAVDPLRVIYLRRRRRELVPIRASASSRAAPPLLAFFSPRKAAGGDRSDRVSLSLDGAGRDDERAARRLRVPPRLLSPRRWTAAALAVTPPAAAARRQTRGGHRARSIRLHAAPSCRSRRESREKWLWPPTTTKLLRAAMAAASTASSATSAERRAVPGRRRRRGRRLLTASREAGGAEETIHSVSPRRRRARGAPSAVASAGESCDREAISEAMFAATICTAKRLAAKTARRRTSAAPVARAVRVPPSLAGRRTRVGAARRPPPARDAAIEPRLCGAAAPPCAARRRARAKGGEAAHVPVFACERRRAARRCQASGRQAPARRASSAFHARRCAAPGASPPRRLSSTGALKPPPKRKAQRCRARAKAMARSGTGVRRRAPHAFARTSASVASPASAAAGGWRGGKYNGASARLAIGDFVQEVEAALRGFRRTTPADGHVRRAMLRRSVGAPCDPTSRRCLVVASRDGHGLLARPCRADGGARQKSDRPRLARFLALLAEDRLHRWQTPPPAFIRRVRLMA